MNPCLLPGVLVLLIAAAAGAGPQPAENRVVLNIEPTKEHPRSSEGAFVTLKSGRILFLYTQFYGGASDKSAARIVRIHSDDGGRTWSSPPRVAVENSGKENVMSVSLLRLKSGKIALFYLQKNDLSDCRPRMCLSTDEGETWSAPRPVIDAPGYFVLNNDRVIQLASGRLVMPVAYHRLKGSDPNSYRSFDARALGFWYLSDDDGATWREADTWWAIPTRSSTGLQEPGVVELPDGSLFTWARTDQGAQFGSSSSDGGRSWSPPSRTSLESPVSPASIKRIPGSDELLAIYNDHSGKYPFPKGKRTPLVAALSTDGGKTWPRRTLLEADPEGWYCYTAIEFVGDAVLLGYCAGDAKVGGLNRLRIRRVGLDLLRGN
jgi:sialidase-1